MKEFNIRETLGYQLALASKDHKSKIGELFSQKGLYVGQEMFLTYLFDHNNITQKELAEGIGLQPATITKVVKRLEKAGYLERSKDSNDKRSMRINLTPKGVEIQEFIAKSWIELEEMTFSSFSIEEKVIFRRLMQQINQNLDPNSSNNL